MSFIVRASDDGARDARLVGGKGRALASSTNAGMLVPEWFAITPSAWHASLTEQRVELGGSAAELATLRGVRPSEAVMAHVVRALQTLGGDPEANVAIRSSAIDEDGAAASFAGQLDSFLYVAPGEIADRVARVWASALSERALAYRRNRGIHDAPTPPAIVVQRMIQPDVSGVAFSADPVSGSRGIAVVSAVYGLGTALVAGEADADTYKVDGDGRVVERHIADKRIAHRRATGIEGVEAYEVPLAQARAAALDDPQVGDVAALARAAQRLFGSPQDIEWAYSGGHLFLLQARPITSLVALADSEAGLTIWDNSNIAESYGGMTTPLTFSFARRAYDAAYRQFFRLLRIPARVMREHDDTFRNMLGLVRGRIYYNLLNWYRLLALLPGFRINRRFMEQMMGLKEELPESIVAELGKGGLVGDAFAIVRTSAALVFHHLTLRRRIKRFYHALDGALDAAAPDLTALRPGEIVAHYRRLERGLVDGWDAPLINDFFAMVFYGLLRKTCAAWCADDAGTLQNDLLCGQGGMISARPAQAIRELAVAAAPNRALVASLVSASAPEALAALERDPRSRELYAAYMREFGDRCDGELKLESPTLRDDPSMLLRAIGRLASQTQAGPASSIPPARLAAEQRAATVLARAPLRRAAFNWILLNARGRIVDRENLRFARTRLFGRIRAIFVELGRQLAAEGALREPRDIFYLELDEVLSFVESPAADADLKARVQARKREAELYRHMPPPPDRFETYGALVTDAALNVPATKQRANRFAGAATHDAAESRRGIGCCPGQVRGIVRVVRDPNATGLRQGEILVAERTDPSWVMLFPAAHGILVERGSLLSHAAIVAREMAIPAIVSIEGLCSWLQDGDEVEFDGASGEVIRVARAAAVTHAQ
jgi:phosphohistidine swiveling domain-containing protein